MAEEKDRLLQTLDKLWKIVQIGGLLLAGFWTYAKYIQTEAPFFEPSVTMNRDLSPATETPDGCSRAFTVGFENSGKSVLTVRKVITQGWRFNFQRSESAFPELLDLDKIKVQGQVVFLKEFPDPSYPNATWFPFLGRYRTAEKYSHEFLLLLK